MSESDVLPYSVLVFDDDATWGKLIEINLQQHEYIVSHVLNWSEATRAIDSNHFDIVVADLDLGTPRTGMDFLEYIRSKNRHQPVILVTGNEQYLDRPIRDYVDALASGPVSFYSKLAEGDFLEIVRESSNRVDPVRRCLAMMCDAGMENEEFQVDGEVYRIKDLLISNEKTDTLTRSLRESLQSLMIELKCRNPDEKGDT